MGGLTELRGREGWDRGKGKEGGRRYKVKMCSIKAARGSALPNITELKPLPHARRDGLYHV